MTVGVAGISGQYSDSPRVVIAADRLVTTNQQSAIEHESPNTKIVELAETIHDVQGAAVFSGDISWSEELHENIEEHCFQLQQQGTEIDGSTLMRVANQQYKQFLNERINNQILSKYGLEMADLQAQHKFKDGFIADLKAEIENAEATVSDRLRLLAGGVNLNVDSAFIFEVGGNDYFRHSNQGYGTIGSGSQPAHSEFIESEYGPQEDFDTCVATVTAATMRARRASGVGGDIDVWCVSQRGITEAPKEILARLEKRYKEIASAQDKVKENLRAYKEINWDPQ